MFSNLISTFKKDNYPDLVVTIRPGNGFSGATSAPESIGSESDYGVDAKSAARWDTVPFQTFNSYFHIGVAAFHINEIDRVEFSINNSPWISVKDKKLNPSTGVIDYWVGIDPKDFEDGQSEIRAIAYPKIGIPRLLAGTDITSLNGEFSMIFFTNYYGTFTKEVLYVSLSGNNSNSGTISSPLATIDRALSLIDDGGDIILLDSGLYEIVEGIITTNQRWITIKPNVGLKREDIIIQCPGVYPDWGYFRQNIGRLKWENISFNFGSISQYYNIDRITWFDKCYWYEDGGWDSREGRLPLVRNTFYVTACKAYDMLYAFVNADLAKDCDAERISGDVYQNSRAIFNCTASNVDGLINEHHTDLYQMWGEADNLVIYGLHGTSNIKDTQSLFIQPTDTPVLNLPRYALNNSAFVNISVENTYDLPENLTNGGTPYSQIQSKINSVLFQDISLPKQRLFLRTDFSPEVTNQWFEANNLVFKRVQFHPLTWDTYSIESNWPDGVKFINCYDAS